MLACSGKESGVGVKGLRREACAQGDGLNIGRSGSHRHLNVRDGSLRLDEDGVNQILSALEAALRQITLPGFVKFYCCECNVGCRLPGA
jgi:hypothetical protein